MSAADDTLPRLTRVLARVLGMDEATLREAFADARPEDLPQLLDLRARVLGPLVTWDDRRYLTWRFGLERGHTPPPGSRLLVLRRREQILGTLGVEELALDGPAGEVPACRLLDLMVEPAINGVGLGAWMNLAAFARYPVALAVGANDDSVKIVNRMFRRMPERRVWVAALDLRRAIERAPALGRVPGLAAAVRLGLGAYRRLLAGASEMRLVEVDPVGDDVERLSRSLAGTGLVLARRTAAKWNWRFLANPRVRYRAFHAVDGGRVVAALVLRRGADDAGEIADLLWDGALPPAEQERALTAALVRALEIFSAEGASAARVMAYDALTERVYRRLGFLRRPHRAAFAVRAADPAQLEALAAARWFVTFGDSDDD